MATTATMAPAATSKKLSTNMQRPPLRTYSKRVLQRNSIPSSKRQRTEENDAVDAPSTCKKLKKSSIIDYFKPSRVPSSPSSARSDSIFSDPADENATPHSSPPSKQSSPLLKLSQHGIRKRPPRRLSTRPPLSLLVNMPRHYSEEELTRAAKRARHMTVKDVTTEGGLKPGRILHRDGSVELLPDRPNPNYLVPRDRFAAITRIDAIANAKTEVILDSRSREGKRGDDKEASGQVAPTRSAVNFLGTDDSLDSSSSSCSDKSTTSMYQEVAAAPHGRSAPAPKFLRRSSLPNGEIPWEPLPPGYAYFRRGRSFSSDDSMTSNSSIGSRRGNRPDRSPPSQPKMIPKPSRGLNGSVLDVNKKRNKEVTRGEEALIREMRRDDPISTSVVKPSGSSLTSIYRNTNQSQLNIGVTAITQCSACKFAFNSSDNYDVISHQRAHTEFRNGIHVGNLKPHEGLYGISKLYSKIDDKNIESYIVSVDRGASHHWKNIAVKALDQVNRDLGAPQLAEAVLWDTCPNPHEYPDLLPGTQAPKVVRRYKVFLFVYGQHVTSILLAERIKKGYETNLEQITSDEYGEWPSIVAEFHMPINEQRERLAFLGVSRIWTVAKYKRRKMALRLLRIATETNAFVYGRKISRSLFAFSQTTYAGGALAQRFCDEIFDTCDYLTYFEQDM